MAVDTYRLDYYGIVLADLEARRDLLTRTIEALEFLRPQAGPVEPATRGIGVVWKLGDGRIVGSDADFNNLQQRLNTGAAGQD